MVKGSFFLVFLLKSLSLRFCHAAQSCTKVDSCTCRIDEKTFIDLHSLAGTDNFAFGYKAATTFPDEFTYAWNPCNPITEPSSDCNNAASCRKDSTSSLTVGTQDTAHFDTNGQNIVLKYTAPGPDGVPLDVWVELICDPNQKDPLFTVDGDVSYLIYQYKLTSKCCCPNGCKKSSGGGKSGLSFGSILCILFSVFFVVYIACGLGYAKYKGKTGKEMIPNYGFWSDLPYLIMDGFQFCVSMLKGESYAPKTSGKTTDQGGAKTTRGVDYGSM